MTMREFYDAQGGSYADVIERMGSEALVLKFLLRLPDDSAFPRLKQAIASGDQEESFKAIHTFKGVCLNMGLEKLFRASSELTEAVRTEFSPEAPALFEVVVSEYHQVCQGIGELKALYS